MTTSGSTTFNSTMKEIIDDAFALINIYGVDDSVDSNDFNLAKRYLNRMIKTWQAQGYHLWPKETVYLFTAAGQIEYALKTGGDNATLAYYQTTLSADAATSATFVTVTDVSNITVGDYIGVLLDTNNLFWSKVDSISTNDVYFTSGDTLPSASSSGQTVYNYTTMIEEPFNVYSAHRRGLPKEDIPMNFLSYEEYQQLPDKEGRSIPVSYNYDRQRDEAIIRIWPAPTNSEFIIILTIYRKIQDFVTNSNTPDFPQEWLEPIVFNLAVKLAYAFRKNQGELFNNLLQQANGSLSTALSFDNEPGSVYLQPDYLTRYGE